MATISFTKQKTWQESLIDQVVNTEEKSFKIKLKIFGELLIRNGNRWVKNTNPVTMQRDSSKRAKTDVVDAYYFKKNPNTDRCRGYDRVAANMGNTLIVTTKDIVDTFGVKIPAFSILQLNGNTNLVAQCQLLNGDIPIPNDYQLSDFTASKDEELDFDVMVISNQADYNFYYKIVDNTVSAKSKDDNYSSCLVGHKLLNYETGETDLITWVTRAMDRPLSYLNLCAVPKDIPEMNKIFSEYKEVIVNVREKTSPIINNGGSNQSVWKAFCLDLSKLELSGKLSPLQLSSLLDNLGKEITQASDKNVEEYWNNKFFGIKKKRGSSIIDTKLGNFNKFVCSPKSSWTQLSFTIEDWILWELFSVTRDDIRDAQDHRLYGHGGGDILGGKDRTDVAHQSLNFLRTLLLYANHINFKSRFTAIKAFEWAEENICTKFAAVDQVDRLDILADKKVKLALKSHIYA